jgi:hypothetical protein
VAERLIILLDTIHDVEGIPTSLRVADAAAKALEDTMREGTVHAIGADLRLSGFRGGPVVFRPERSAGHAAVTMSGGTYALADAGRQQARRRILPKRRRLAGTKRKPALGTPGGPRRSVRGSRWRGKRITDTYGPKALEAAVEAAQRTIADLFAKAV